jgi:hypothetical protein
MTCSRLPELAHPALARRQVACPRGGRQPEKAGSLILGRGGRASGLSFWSSGGRVNLDRQQAHQATRLLRAGHHTGPSLPAAARHAANNASPKRAPPTSEHQRAQRASTQAALVPNRTAPLYDALSRPSSSARAPNRAGGRGPLWPAAWWTPARGRCRSPAAGSSRSTMWSRATTSRRSAPRPRSTSASCCTS